MKKVTFAFIFVLFGLCYGDVPSHGSHNEVHGLGHGGKPPSSYAAPQSDYSAPQPPQDQYGPPQPTYSYSQPSQPQKQKKHKKGNYGFPNLFKGPMDSIKNMKDALFKSIGDLKGRILSMKANILKPKGGDLGYDSFFKKEKAKPQSYNTPYDYNVVPQNSYAAPAVQPQNSYAAPAPVVQNSYEAPQLSTGYESPVNTPIGNGYGPPKSDDIIDVPAPSNSYGAPNSLGVGHHQQGDVFIPNNPNVKGRQAKQFEDEQRVIPVPVAFRINPHQIVIPNPSSYNRVKG